MEGYLSEIRMFAGNFSPMGWQFCQGQLMSIAQNTAVFALVGTTYGGDGQTTFGLPNFQGRFALGTGQGGGQPVMTLGQMSGANSVTLTTANMPIHNHSLSGTVTPQANSDGTLSSDATSRYLGPTNSFTDASSDLASMAPALSTLAIGIAGQSQPVNTQAPYIGMNFIFCMEGIFPSRD